MSCKKVEENEKKQEINVFKAFCKIEVNFIK